MRLIFWHSHHFYKCLHSGQFHILLRCFIWVVFLNVNLYFASFSWIISKIGTVVCFELTQTLYMHALSGACIIWYCINSLCKIRGCDDFLALWSPSVPFPTFLQWWVMAHCHMIMETMAALQNWGAARLKSETKTTTHILLFDTPKADSQ